MFSKILDLGLKISRLVLLRPGIGHGLDSIFKSILVLVLVSNKINGLDERRFSARLLVSKFKTWPVKTKFWTQS